MEVTDHRPILQHLVSDRGTQTGVSTMFKATLILAAFIAAASPALAGGVNIAVNRPTVAMPRVIVAPPTITARKAGGHQQEFLVFKFKTVTVN
jgi:hypothetical protein